MQACHLHIDITGLAWVYRKLIPRHADLRFVLHSFCSYGVEFVELSYQLLRSGPGRWMTAGSCVCMTPLNFERCRVQASSTDDSGKSGSDDKSLYVSDLRHNFGPKNLIEPCVSRRTPRCRRLLRTLVESPRHFQPASPNCGELLDPMQCASGLVARFHVAHCLVRLDFDNVAQARVTM